MRNVSNLRRNAVLISCALIPVVAGLCLGTASLGQGNRGPVSFCVELNREAQVSIDIGPEGAFVIQDIIVAGGKTRQANEFVTFTLDGKPLLVTDTSGQPLHFTSGITIHRGAKLVLKGGVDGTLFVTLCGEVIS